MGKIKYSVRETTVKWGDHAGEKRYSANLQTSGTISLDKFAEHMADHDCKYNKGDIYSVLLQMSKCIREFILDGYMVSLGDLGVISPRIKQKAATVREEYSAGNITDLYATLKIGPALINMRGEASFEYAPTLASQALLVAAIREGANSVSLVKPTSGSGNSGQNNGGSGSSSTGSEQGGSNGSSSSSSVTAPTISGTTPFDDSTQVTISGPAGSTIKYTTNGVAPTATYGNDYEEPITLNASATVKAVAIVDGVASEVATKLFTKNGSSGGGGEEGM